MTATEIMEASHDAWKSSSSNDLIREKLGYLIIDIELIYDCAFFTGAKWAEEQMKEKQK